jgi:hypothetical protein
MAENSTSFEHNFPTSSLIQASRQIGGKVYRKSYDIISLGYFPQNTCFTKKNKKGVKFKIPNKYKVKTNQSGYDIICETNYQKNSQVLFQITWTNKDGVERIVKSTKSASYVAKLLIEVRLFIYYNLLYVI